MKSARQDRNRKQNLQRFLGMQVLGKWEDTFNTRVYTSAIGGERNKRANLVQTRNAS